MKRYRDKRAIKVVASLAVASALMLVLSNTVTAQRVSSAGPSPGRDRDRENGVREHGRQLQVLLNSKEPAASADARRLHAIIEQTKQDFERIQDINRELVTVLRSNVEFNYRSLTDTAAEIRKRARRLKENISLPPPADDQPLEEKRDGELGPKGMKDALSLLSERITSFASNPLFQTPNLIDVRLGAKAGRDLDAILALSGQIKKSAERLSKPAKKSGD
jgi:hypothetical protein